MTTDEIVAGLEDGTLEAVPLYDENMNVVSVLIRKADEYGLERIIAADNG